MSREAQLFAGRRVTYFHDDDGSVMPNTRLSAESGAVLLKALEVATDECRRADVSAATPVDDFDATGDTKRTLTQRPHTAIRVRWSDSINAAA